VRKQGKPDDGEVAGRKDHSLESLKNPPFFWLDGYGYGERMEGGRGTVITLGKGYFKALWAIVPRRTMEKSSEKRKLVVEPQNGPYMGKRYTDTGYGKPHAPARGHGVGWLVGMRSGSEAGNHREEVTFE
jgi:hypothetical protein